LGPFQLLYLYEFCFFPRYWKIWQQRTVINLICRMYKWSSWEKPHSFVWNTIISTNLSQFQEIY
jgi:hypothetical protein